jgi:hypothetical protein
MQRVPCQTEVNNKSHNVRFPKQVIYIMDACASELLRSTVLLLSSVRCTVVYRVLRYCCYTYSTGNLEIMNMWIYSAGMLEAIQLMPTVMDIGFRIHCMCSLKLWI